MCVRFNGKNKCPCINKDWIYVCPSALNEAQVEKSQRCTAKNSDAFYHPFGDHSNEVFFWNGSQRNQLRGPRNNLLKESMYLVVHADHRSGKSVRGALRVISWVPVPSSSCIVGVFYFLFFCLVSETKNTHDKRLGMESSEL